MTNLPPIDLAATGFCLQNARAAIVACQRAYDEPSDVAVGKFGVRIIDCGNCVIVAFQGTKTVPQWLADGDVKKVPGPAGMVHHGFYEDVQAQLDDILARIKPLNLPVIVVGHSAGGAKAILFAAVAQAEIHSIYTFGQPRVGNAAFAKWYDAFHRRHTFRFVNEEDLVPRVPWLMHSYRHAGTQIFMPSTGGYLVDPGFCRMFVSDCLGEIRAWHRGGILAALEDPLNDHHLPSYSAHVALLTP